MNNFKIGRCLLILYLVLGTSCSVTTALNNSDRASYPLRIGVLADIHFHDVYGEFEAGAFPGILNPINGKRAIFRTMQSQLKSTRLFNENYFAFLAALDDLVERDIKLVILPGDFSDDGQPIHLRGFKQILERYTNDHGMRFFLITGNHDVVEPFASKAGKRDFFGEGGMPQPIMSEKGMYVPDLKKEHPVVVTKDIQSLGYLEVSDMFGDFGFFPQKSDRYWASPFSEYDYGSYSYKKAMAKSDMEYRNHNKIKDGYPFPDLSYVVEPVDGLWLLALDANVFIKTENPKNGSVYYPGVGRGYNNVPDHKDYLIDWVSKVATEAEAFGKTLIAFSHYPMVDFNDGASEDIRRLGIGGQMQLGRVPMESISRTFADIGVKLHFGGHMHLNDTGIYTSEEGNTLVNIQTPSLAAYKPAYKLATVKSNESIDVQTIVLESVPRFNELFGLYQKEHDYLSNRGAAVIWNRSVLASDTYPQYTDWHLRELVRLRFLPQEWPDGFISYFSNLNGREILDLAVQNSSMNTFNGTEISQIDLKELENWSGFDFLFDLYRLRSADELAKDDIGEERLRAYRYVIESFLDRESTNLENDDTLKYITDLMQVFNKFLNGEPSDHIQVNLRTGKVTSNKQADKSWE
ncbi:MAG TPA: metallophosphoesterase [Arenibacter sp.]|nr:metallophosphoesterase [Arenibacter sp.]